MTIVISGSWVEQGTGGMHSSVHDKKRLFEILLGRKVFYTPIDMDQIYRKIRYESPSLLSDDQGWHISGHDSIGKNFAGFTQSTTDTERQSVSRYSISLPELYSNRSGGRHLLHNCCSTGFSKTIYVCVTL